MLILIEDFGVELVPVTIAVPVRLNCALPCTSSAVPLELSVSRDTGEGAVT